MQRYRTMGLTLLSVWLLQPASLAEAARYPNPDVNHLQWFYVFGADGDPYYGAEHKPKSFFVEVPSALGAPVTMRVVDADTRGKHDELSSGWDTTTRFRVFGGATQLASETVDHEAPDGTVLRLGPFQPSQGEQQGNLAVFRIEVEGLAGDDNNLFAFEVTPDGAQFYAYDPAVRLAPVEGQRMYFYPEIPLGTTTVHEANFDLDPRGGSLDLLPPRRPTWGSVFYKALRLNNSRSAEWAETTLDITQQRTGGQWIYQITKETQDRANMSFRLADQAGQPLRIFFTPGQIIEIAQRPEPTRLGCNSFEFDASKSYDLDNQQLSFHWDLGDGTTSTDVRLKHTYTAGGDYPVTLTVTDSSTAMCRQSRVSQILNVNTAPVAAVHVPTSACTGMTVRLSGAGTTDTPGQTLTYQWDLGDGTTADGVDVTHTYARGGNYQIALRVDDNQGTTCSQDMATATIRVNSPPIAKAPASIVQCSRNLLDPLEVRFDAAGSSDPDGDTLIYRWDFGDGSAREEGRTAHHFYQQGGAYTATLLIDDGSSTACSMATATIPVTLNRAPIAVANQDVSTCAGQTVAFDGSLSEDPDGRALTYHWDFGDGATGTGAQATHTYTSGGLYHARLTVDDGTGSDCSATSADVAARINSKPTIIARMGDKSCIGQPAQFDASRSQDPEGQSLRIAWDFGDGTTVEGGAAQHVYAKGGTYPVQVTIDDGQGTNCSIAQARGTMRVNSPPTASAGPNLVCCQDQTNVFDGSRSADPDGDALVYRWDFGDGTTVEGQRAQHAFRERGQYQVRLWVDDGSDSGCSTATDQFLAEVNVAPVAQMVIRGEGRTRAIPATAGE